MGVEKIDALDRKRFLDGYDKPSESRVRIEALEIEVASLKQEIKLLNNKLESLGQQFGKWAITYI